MRCSKIINRGKFAPGKILVVCIGQNQKDAREGAKGEGSNAGIISSVSAKITLQKIEWVGAEHGD